MPRPLIDLREARPLLDIATYGRLGPGARVSLPELEMITRTVRRTPEVMVKVSGGATSSHGALAHLRYIDRQGRLELETDDGKTVQGSDAGRTLVADWDLEVLAAESRSPYRGKAGRKPAKLVHNIVLSMPAGTPPEKLLAASREFAREEFALKHRYAMVLHTDQEHPHVHLVVRSVSEEGRRLNIRKATLRDWRRRFAAQLRAQGVAANATERAVRGQTRPPIRDAIFRAALRGESTHVRRRLEQAAKRLHVEPRTPDPGALTLQETRRKVVEGWHATVERLLADGHGRLAEQVWKFIGGMPPPQTEQQRFDRALATRMDQDRHLQRDARVR
jgi:hypothetical protein